MYKCTVRYQLATYEGRRVVVAEDDDDAVAKVRKWARSQTSLVMFSDSYRVEKVESLPD